MSQIDLWHLLSLLLNSKEEISIHWTDEGMHLEMRGYVSKLNKTGDIFCITNVWNIPNHPEDHVFEFALSDISYLIVRGLPLYVIV